jgi:branched-chain amino acid aminotransferase
MIHHFISHNGRLLPVEESRLSPGQSGLLNGWGLFTTVRIVEGIPFAFGRHWKRLKRDAERTRCPFPYEEGVARGQLSDVLRANEVREGCARIYVVTNQTGLWRSDENMPAVDLLICSADLPAHRDPVRLSVREHGRHAASPLAGTKVTAWLNNVWCLQEAQRAGFDEVVLLNERGEVSECTSANIFCVRGGRVATPPLDSGCLEGVTRNILLEIGAGAPMEERTLFPEDLYVADEVFISSTNRGVLAVAEIAGRKTAAVPGHVTKELERAFAAYVREYVDARAVTQAKR